MTQSVKDEAKFLDTRLDDETAAVLEKWNLVILGAALLHDADHIRQAIRWHYKIPIQLWIINLAVYVLPTVAEFLLKNKRTSSFLTVAANGIVTSAAFLKVHLFKPTTDIWGAWNYNYFKLARGVWHEGQFIKGIDWIDWALLLDLPAVAIPACMTAIKKRREFKQNLLEAAGEANSAIRKLMHLQPRTAMVQRGDTFVELPVDQIAEHDLVRIRPGERVPVDGTVVSGQCAVDESMLTGESMPVDKAPGDKVIGGSLNRSGSAIVSAEALGKASVLEQIIQIVCQAQCEKAPVQRFADKVARWFVPGVIGAAALTFLIWYRRIAPRNLERALLTCCDVLSVACPCALGLATPTGLMVGSGRAAEHGILFKSGAELENAYKADCVVFDKTGTLTNGAPALTDICPCSGVQPETLVRLAAALEQCSDHPLARAVTAYAQQQSDVPLPPAEDFSYALGRGVRGTVAGAAVVCGSRTWLRELGIDTAALTALPDLRAQAKTELCVALGGVVLGTLGIADTRKSEAAAVVAQLRAAGKEVWMMTGDHARTAEAIAAEVGIDHVLSEVRPDEKAAAIERLRAQGKTVCMVGDGINDTPALAVADCAVAMGGGSDIAIESAGILLPSGNLEKLPELFDISRATIRTIRQNLTWALFYNLVSIPVAALGVLHPSICATAMSASSIGVLMHSLRLKDSDKKERRFPWKKKS